MFHILEQIVLPIREECFSRDSDSKAPYPTGFGYSSNTRLAVAT